MSPLLPHQSRMDVAGVEPQVRDDELPLVMRDEHQREDEPRLVPELGAIYPRLGDGAFL
jgi:hypothetical protein